MMSGQQPIIVLKEGTERSRGKGAQFNNIAAAKAVAEAVRSTLGSTLFTAATVRLAMIGNEMTNSPVITAHGVKSIPKPPKGARLETRP